MATGFLSGGQGTKRPLAGSAEKGEGECGGHNSFLANKRTVEPKKPLTKAPRPNHGGLFDLKIWSKGENHPQGHLQFS